jgi:amidase
VIFRDPIERPDHDIESPPVTRREFLHSAAVGVTLVAGGRLVAPNEPATRPVAWPSALPESLQAFELNEITIGALQAGMREGRFTARSVTELYLRRMEQIDSAGPRVRAMIELNPDALQIAEALDKERAAGKLRGPLHGVPVVLKDVVDTADRMRTTSGSLALAQSFARQDAFIARRLRDAGAVILGKCNMSEWSNVRSTRATSGWSARGGLTKNPYILDRTACGSSSGTGAAVAANFATIGVGAETDGSIACPASANCLVGIKPTVGLWSRSGLIPVSYSQDTPGPMARTVTDAAILLGALTGVDPRDPATTGSQEFALQDYTRNLNKRALQGARLGVIRRQHESDPALDRVLDQALDILRSAGAVIVRDFEIPSMDELQGPETFVLICEFKDAIRDYLATRGPDEKHRSLADLIRFNQENSAIEMPWFGQDWFEASERTQGRATDRYGEALARCRTLARTQGLDRVLGEHRLDAIVGLAATTPFASDLVVGDRPIVRNSSLSAVSGYPRITVPGGFIHGLPVGLSFMGAAWSEARLLGLAYAFEQAAPARRSPQFLLFPIMDK